MMLLEGLLVENFLTILVHIKSEIDGLMHQISLPN